MERSNYTAPYPDWIDSKTEITDENSISFVKFKLAVPFANFKSRDRLWITDDNDLITYICDPRDIAKNARKAGNIKIKIPINDLVGITTMQKGDVTIIAIDTNNEVCAGQFTNLGKMLFFYFRDADKALKLKDTIRSKGDKNLLINSQSSSDDGAELQNHTSNRTKPDLGKNNGFDTHVLGIPIKSNSHFKADPHIFAPESNNGDFSDDETLVLPFGTQIPRRRAVSLPEGTQHRIPSVSKGDTVTAPQPDYDDTVQDLLNHDSMKELKSIFDGAFVHFGMDRIKEQKRFNEAQKRLHSDFWRKVEREKEEKEVRLHTITKDFSEKVPVMTKKIAAFHQTLRNGLTTFPTVTQAITHTLEVIEKEKYTLVDLEPSFNDD